MIQLREMKVTDESSGRTGRACSGCGKTATTQIVGMTIVGNVPSVESVDMCDRCRRQLTKKLVVMDATEPSEKSSGKTKSRR